MATTREKIGSLEKIAAALPEYADILSLFRELFACVRGREGESGISFAPPGDHCAERAGNGFPLLTRESMRVDAGKAARFLADIVGVLRRMGREGEEALVALERALAAGEVDLPALFGACLARERRQVDEAAAAVGVPAPLLEFVAETALQTALGHFTEGLDPAMFAGWHEGYCPVCGSRAGMAELAGEEGRRSLCCSACHFTWPFPRITCPYCGNAEAGSLSYLEAGEGPTRVDVCHKCSRYLKTRDSRQGRADVPLEVEDLVTIHLDLLALREGFERGK